MLSFVPLNGKLVITPNMNVSIVPWGVEIIHTSLKMHAHVLGQHAHIRLTSFMIFISNNPFFFIPLIRVSHSQP